MSNWQPWRVLVVILSGLLLWGWVAARAAASQHAHAPGRTHTHGQTPENELPAGGFTAESLYQLPSIWTTATEQRLRLGDLRGKARVLVMHYTSCEYACPILLSIVKNIEGAIEPAVDVQAKYYLPQMFGSGNFQMLPHPAHLVRGLTDVYRRLSH